MAMPDTLENFGCAYQLAILIVCSYCWERIGPRDSYRDGACQRFHVECLFRSVAGSAAHILKECLCYGGDREDPPGMSLREAAIVSLNTWLAINGER